MTQPFESMLGAEKRRREQEAYDDPQERMARSLAGLLGSGGPEDVRASRAALGLVMGMGGGGAGGNVGAAVVPSKLEIPQLLKALTGKAKTALGKIPWGEMTLGEAREAAQKGAHLQSRGKQPYVGAPPSVKSGSGLSALRKNIDESVAKGDFNADWYERAQGAHHEMAGGDPALIDKISQMDAVYSPQATPDVNLGRSLQQWNDVALRGKASRVQPYYKDMAEKGRRILGGEVLTPEELGPKVGIYEGHINPNKAAKAKTQGVNDVWMTRDVYGYPRYAPGEAQHSFMTGENLLAAERAGQKGLLPEGVDPNVGNVQAASWGGKRLEKYMKQKGVQQELQRLYENADFEGIAKLEEDLKRRASQSYDREVLDKYTGRQEYTSIPARGTGHLEGVQDLPLPEQEKIQRALEWKDEKGRDPILGSMGMLQRPGEPTAIPFKGSVKRPMLEAAIVDPTSKALLAKGRTHFNALQNLSFEEMHAIEEAPNEWEHRMFVKNPEGKILSREEASKVADSFGNTDRILDPNLNKFLHEVEGGVKDAPVERALASEDLLGHNPEVDMPEAGARPGFAARPMIAFEKGGKGLSYATKSLLKQGGAFRSAMDVNAPVKPGGGELTSWLMKQIEPRVGEKLSGGELAKALERKNVRELEVKDELGFQARTPRADVQKLRAMVAEHGVEGTRKLINAAGGGVRGAIKLGLPAVAITYLGGDDDAEEK